MQRAFSRFLLSLLTAVMVMEWGFASMKVSGSLGQCKSVMDCILRLENNKRCRILPVPKRAQEVIKVLPPGKFLLTKLRKGVWAYNDGLYVSLILKMGSRLAMLDLPDSHASSKPDGSMTRLTDAAEQILNGTVPRRIDIVYSHAHFDHIGGSTRFYNYMTAKYPSVPIFIWGTEEARELIQASVTKRAIMPNLLVGKKGRTLSLGRGLKVEMEMLGGHTATDLALYIPRYKEETSILMFVDVVFAPWAPAANLGVTINVGKYIDAQKAILKKDFDIFVGGHFGLGRKGDVVTNLRFTQDLVDIAKSTLESITTEKLFQDGFLKKFTDPFAPEFKNIWYAFIEVERGMQVDACYRVMLEKWGCTLGGLDLTLRGYCFTALTYLGTHY